MAPLPRPGPQGGQVLGEARRREAVSLGRDEQRREDRLVLGGSPGLDVLQHRGAIGGRRLDDLPYQASPAVESRPVGWRDALGGEDRRELAEQGLDPGAVGRLAKLAVADAGAGHQRIDRRVDGELAP